MFRTSKGDMNTAGDKENCIQNGDMVEMKTSNTILPPSIRSLEDDLFPYFRAQGTREREEGTTSPLVSLLWLSLVQLQAILSRREVAWKKGQGRGELQMLLVGAMGEEEVRRELLQLCSPVSRRERGLSVRRRQQPSCRRWPDWREVAEREERNKEIKEKAAEEAVKNTNVIVDDGPAPSTDMVNIEGYHFRSFKTYEKATKESSCSKEQTNWMNRRSVGIGF